MKIGILTQSLHNNYGGLLQNYALQTVLKKKGYEVRTLDWKWVNHSPIKTCLRRTVSRLLGKSKKSAYKPNQYELNVIHRNVDSFKDKYIVHTEKFECRDDFADYDAKVHPDAYIVGSDQCWRPRYNPFQDEMFLSFVMRQDVKRIAYAASFGTDQWEFEDTPKFRALSSKFDMVSTREASGVELCKHYLGLDAFNVLDPTMLLEKEDYIKLVEAEENSPSAGDLFYYILDPRAEIYDTIRRIGVKLKLTPFMVLPKYKEEYRTKQQVKYDIENCVYPSPICWIKGIMDAKLAIVDSFHGMVFSIIFNKPFWVIGNKERGMSRFTSLLEMFGLQDRLVSLDNLEVIDLMKPIDWDKVNTIKESKRQESLTLLLNAITK